MLTFNRGGLFRLVLGHDGEAGRDVLHGDVVVVPTEAVGLRFLLKMGRIDTWAVLERPICLLVETHLALLGMVEFIRHQILAWSKVGLGALTI